MNKSFSKLILAGVVALTTAGASLPAHATISGSNPRPPSTPPSSPHLVSIILAVLGY